MKHNDEKNELLYSGRDKIIETAIDLIDRILKYLPSKITNSRTGGYLSIRCRHTGEPLDVIKINEIPRNKSTRYYRNSLEKGRRLFKNGSNFHISSWQSRIEDMAGQF